MIPTEPITFAQSSICLAFFLARCHYSLPQPQSQVAPPLPAHPHPESPAFLFMYHNLPSPAALQHKQHCAEVLPQFPAVPGPKNKKNIRKRNLLPETAECPLSIFACDIQLLLELLPSSLPNHIHKSCLIYQSFHIPGNQWLQSPTTCHHQNNHNKSSQITTVFHPEIYVFCNHNAS